MALSAVPEQRRRYPRPSVSGDFRQAGESLRPASRPNAPAALRQPARAFRRYRGACAAIALDRDGFKAFNDTFGHLAGNRGLAAVAEALVTATRGEDVVAGIGGDEFAVPLTEADFLGASSGIAVNLHRTCELDSLLAYADDALCLTEHHEPGGIRAVYLGGSHLDPVAIPLIPPRHSSRERP